MKGVVLVTGAGGFVGSAIVRLLVKSMHEVRPGPSGGIMADHVVALLSPRGSTERLEELPKEGVKKLVILCPAFVADCLETLEEIAMAGKESFLNAGGESYTVIPCLNTHSLWVDALASWIGDN